MSHTRPVTFGGQLHCPPKLAQVDERLKLEQLHAGHDRCTQSENNSSYKQYELTKVGSDQRSSTIQYDSKSEHSKRRQTVN